MIPTRRTLDGRRAVRLGLLALLAALLGACAAARPVSFPTEDGGVVFADVYGEGASVVVLAHGGRFAKESWSDQAWILVGEGFKVVAFDFRGRGASRGGAKAMAPGEGVEYDVLAAVRYAREKGAEHVYVVGASFGGWAAARAAVLAPGEIERLVLLAASVDEPEKLAGRKLFVVARDDFRGEGVLRLPEIRAQYERTPPPKQLVVLDGAAHAQTLFRTEQAGPAMEAIVRFLTAP